MAAALMMGMHGANECLASYKAELVSVPTWMVASVAMYLDRLWTYNGT